MLGLAGYGIEKAEGWSGTADASFLMQSKVAHRGRPEYEALGAQAGVLQEIDPQAGHPQHPVPQAVPRHPWRQRLPAGRSKRPVVWASFLPAGSVKLRCTLHR
jgi:hypothetical protein